jgi:hypothetical protein
MANRMYELQPNTAFVSDAYVSALLRRAFFSAPQRGR